MVTCTIWAKKLKQIQKRDVKDRAPNENQLPPCHLYINHLFHYRTPWMGTTAFTSYSNSTPSHFPSLSCPLHFLFFDYIFKKEKLFLESLKMYHKLLLPSVSLNLSTGWQIGSQVIQFWMCDNTLLTPPIETGTSCTGSSADRCVL